MSGAPRVRSMNVADSESRPVLGPAGNKAVRKASPKPFRKAAEKTDGEAGDEKKKKAATPVDPPSLSSPSVSAAARLRRQEMLLHSNLSLNASCSSDASTDSFCSRASTGRIGRRPGMMRRYRTFGPRAEKVAGKMEKVVPDDTALPPPKFTHGKMRCSWVTPNTDPCYVAFHDEEWGVPVHDDRKLFELLVLSGALAELTWPAILSKRHIFREVFMDFDPLLVSKLNEKKLIARGSTAITLLSEPKVRAIIENARQILEIIKEFGSFERYCWSFVNNNPINGRFRYPRQVPVKTPKADVISKDLVRRGFRSVGPTVIYSFMQAAGITNDHLISCYRFEECATTLPADLAPTDAKSGVKASHKMDEKITATEEVLVVDLELPVAVDGLSISS